MEKCEKCDKEYISGNPVKTVGLKRTGNICSGGGRRGKCRLGSNPKAMLSCTFHCRILTDCTLK